MHTHDLPSFAQLRERLGDTSLDSTTCTTEAERVLAYLSDFGFAIESADDVLEAVEQLHAEEELSAHRCVEGAAVAHASDGWLLLFPHTDFPERGEPSGRQCEGESG